MEQQALALKYRPMDFDELVGQEAVSRTLSLALDSKRLSHAYLFSGLRGSGKTSSARIFARLYNARVVLDLSLVALAQIVLLQIRIK